MPTTPQELWSLISSTISSSRYDPRTSGIPSTGAFAPKSSSALHNIVMRTKDRTSLHDSMQEFLNTKGIPWEWSTQGSSTVLSFEIKGLSVLTRILIKPLIGNAWLKTGFRNTLLENFKNNNPQATYINGTPDNATEYEIIKKFNDKLEDLGRGSPVHVLIKGDLYQNIIGMVPGPFGHKADFVGIDVNGAAKFFISHKDGNTARSFQQYSGISSRAGDSIHDHEQVVEFRKIISEKQETDFYGRGYYMKIKDTNLKQRAVFGKDFDNGADRLSSNNINLFAQGQVNLTIIERATKRKRAKLRMDFTTKLLDRGQINDLNGTYEPTLFARQGEEYRTVSYKDPSLSDDVEYKGSVVRGVRAGVFSDEYIQSRSMSIDVSSEED